MKLTPPFVVVIDRTEWKFGSSWHNILTLLVASEDVAVPILRRFLKRKACSDDAEREAIMSDFLQMFAVSDIKYVCADREFASVRWLEFLRREKISYRLWIKANHALDGQARQTDQSAEMIADGACRRSGDLSAMAKVVGQIPGLCDGQKAGGRRIIDSDQQ